MHCIRRPTTSAHGLRLLVDIIKQRPSTVIPVSHQYYKLLVTLRVEQRLLIEAAWAPLVQEQAYEAFAFSFLTTPGLVILEETTWFAEHVDLQSLSHCLLNCLSSGHESKPRSDLLWLLAHFICLNNGHKESEFRQKQGAANSQAGKLQGNERKAAIRAVQEKGHRSDFSAATCRDTAYLSALYLQLSILMTDIRARFATRELQPAEDTDKGQEPDSSHLTPLPEYVAKQLEFLVNDEGITALLHKFTAFVCLPKNNFIDKF